MNPSHKGSGGPELRIYLLPQRLTLPVGDTMQIRFFSAFLFSLLLFNLPEAYSDDVSKGRDYFLNKCIGCHAFACNRDGHESYAPKLGGLFGRKAGGVEDYTGYSDGYKNSKIIWTDETLDEFFKDPGNIDPESIMADKGNGKIDTAEHRQQIIAYLKTEDPTVNFFCSK